MRLFLLTGLILLSLFVRPQTATNWTSNDCNGNPHTLFNELDSGKVVVLVWVMPCGLCIGPAQTAYNVVQSFVSSGCPVVYYLVDDYANTNCTTLSNWASSNGIGPNTINFSNSIIDMQDYGAPAMPKVVVLARNDHAVYNVQDNNVNASALQAAISQACNDVLNGVGQVGSSSLIRMFPNPSPGFTEMVFHISNPSMVSFEILNAQGIVVKRIDEMKLSTGTYSQKIEIPDPVPGLYFVLMRSEDNTGILRWMISR